MQNHFEKHFDDYENSSNSVSTEAVRYALKVQGTTLQGIGTEFTHSVQNI